jgi:hypothetical protein
MIIYRVTDRIPVKIGGLTFWLSPMKTRHKERMISLIRQTAGKEDSDPLEQARLSIQFCLKAITGAKNPDGSDYVLELDEDGIPTEDAMADVFQLDAVASLTTVALSWLSGPKQLEIPGVEVDFGAVEVKKK